jgi:hypothetical protein
MARKKSFFGSLLSSGKSTGSCKGFADAMKILRSTKPTKRRNSKATAGIFK